MPVPYAAGKKAFGFCDRCGFRTDLRKLKYEYVKQRVTGLLVCPTCWTKDHPQLMLGTFPINDPQALRNPRPDQPIPSRDIQWGWNPIGGGNGYVSNTPNTLAPQGLVGTVTVLTVTLLNYALIQSALLSAAVRVEPYYTQFALTKLSGRSLGDINNSGSVTAADASAYQRWRNGTSSAAETEYITQTMHPYILANPTTYAAYIL